MKSEVYSWIVSADIKSGLEQEARRRHLSLAAALDEAARDWLGKSSAGDEQAQTRLRNAASRWIGAISGGDPSRAENARRLVRDRLRKRHGR